MVPFQQLLHLVSSSCQSPCPPRWTGATFLKCFKYSFFPHAHPRGVHHLALKRSAASLVTMKIFVALAFFVASCSADPPVFAQDFYSGIYNSLALNQGGINTADGACCEPTAAQCKIQTIAEGSDEYVEYSKNRTRTDSPQGIVANLYLEKKQVALQPDNNGGYVCAQYCPLDEVMEPLAIKKTALHLGKHKITQGGSGGQTKEVDLYYFTDRKFLNTDLHCTHNITCLFFRCK